MHPVNLMRFSIIFVLGLLLSSSFSYGQDFSCLRFGEDPNSILVDASISSGYTDQDESQRRKCIALALENGANPNTKDPTLESLILAAKNSDAESAKLLIAKGADVNFRDKNGMSALEHAASAMADDVVELLLAAGAKTESLSVRHLPALSWATMKADLRAVRALLAHGANVNALVRYGAEDAPETALDVSNADLSLLKSFRSLVKSGPEDDDNSIREEHAPLRSLNLSKARPLRTLDQIIKDQKQINTLLRKAGAR